MYVLYVIAYSRCRVLCVWMFKKMICIPFMIYNFHMFVVFFAATLRPWCIRNIHLNYFVAFRSFVLLWTERGDFLQAECYLWETRAKMNEYFYLICANMKQLNFLLVDMYINHLSYWMNNFWYIFQRYVGCFE